MGSPLVSQEVQAWGVVAAIILVNFIFHLAIPQRPEPGYVVDSATGQPLMNRYNGLKVHAAVVAVAVLLVNVGLVDGAFLCTNFWSCLRGSCAIGIAFSAALYMEGLVALRSDDKNGTAVINRNLSAPTTLRPTQPHPSATEFDSRSSLQHFYCGFKFNPRFKTLCNVDFKMFLYLVGANLLHLNILSAAYLHHTQAEAAGIPTTFLGLRLSTAMLTYVAQFSWFLVEYLHYENVHAFTYDLFRERLGFKLTWGCLCFYPFFYCCGVMCLVGNVSPETDMSGVAAVGCVVLFLCGWVLTRGSNLQKHAFRVNPSAKSFSFPLFCHLLKVKQQPLDASGPGSRLLVSGWWGLARHVGYLGEIIQASALALPGVLATGSLVPLLYPLYYVALFVPRQLDDDVTCTDKYGADVWQRYTRRVPSRIVPGVY